MAQSYDRRINLFVNGQEVKNNVASIRGAMFKLTNELSRMTIGSKEYNQKAAEIRNLKGILADHQAQLRGTATLWQKTAGVFKSILPIFSATAIIGGIAKFATKMKEAVDAADNFEERLDNLSALTGLEGSELEKLGDIAKNTSVKITDGNVRIKQSADDIVDAYTKVGSQRPELLKNAEALAAVTEDAIILSEAAKSDLEPAVAGLTTTMNQFGIGAEGSRRIINAMAAGSKEGAADIPYLTQAIEKSGTTMKLMNVSLEENIGLIEAIAPNYSKAEMAGNSLDKVFLKMKASHIGYKDGVFSVEAALEELEKRFKNGETAVDLFGVEHAKMGELLVQNKDEFTRYTKAVTGTNIAIEQAAKNTDNAAAIQAQARNELHLAAIELGNSFSPAVTSAYKAVGSLAASFTKLISASPEDKIKKEQAELNNLVTSIISANNNQRVRNNLISELQSKYPDFLKNIDTEKISNETLRNKLIEVNALYRERITLAALQEKSTEAQSQGIELAAKEQKIIEDVNNLYQQFRYKGLGFASTFEEQVTAFAKAGKQHGFIAGGVLLGVENLGKEYANVQEEIKQNIKQYEKWATLASKVQQKLGSSGSVDNSFSTTGGPNDTNQNTVAIPENSLGNGGQSNFDLTKAGLDNAFKSEQTILKEQFLQKKITKQQYDQEMYTLELAHLVVMRGLYQQESSEFIEIQGQIIDKKMAWSQQFEDMLQTSQSITEALSENEKNMFADINSEMDKYMADYQDKLNKETEATIEAERIKTEAREKAKEAAITSAFESGAAAVENAQTIEEAGRAILNTIRKQIKAYMAEFVATMVLKALKGVPFPFNIAAAAVAGGTATFLFNKIIPEFASGGFTNGERMYIAGEAGTEWISPNWMTRHPATAPLIANLENLRQRGPHLNPKAVKYFAEGGYTNNTDNKMNNLNKMDYRIDPYGAKGAKMDKMQNEILSELVKKIGNSIDKNTEATTRLMKYRPVVAVETIERERKRYVEVQQTRGL